MEVTYLELSDNKSHKFYEVTINDLEITIRYGRIGSPGTTSTKTYNTPEIAQAAATKKINEKLQKGYVPGRKKEQPQFLRDLPPEFHPLKKILANNLKPYIKITPGEEVGWMNTNKIIGDMKAPGYPLTLWQSKIGGNPYFPKNIAYPVDKITGLAMPLLMQINCADVPIIADFNFPEHGILQFYLGYEPAEAQMTPEKYQVLYFPEISENEHDLITDFSFIENRRTIRENYDKVYPLTFAVSHNLFWESRYIDDDIPIPEELQELAQEFDDWLYEYDIENETGIRGDKLGGYVDFVSTANEVADKAQGRLLLEFSHPFFCSDLFYFFITNADLQNRDFSQVEFYFICD
jgi:uncharacterized protein YwqG/predicted DNA-binding WGR domain protein